MEWKLVTTKLINVSLSFAMLDDQKPELISCWRLHSTWSCFILGVGVSPVVQCDQKNAQSCAQVFFSCSNSSLKQKRIRHLHGVWLARNTGGVTLSNGTVPILDWMKRTVVLKNLFAIHSSYIDVLIWENKWPSGTSQHVLVGTQLAFRSLEPQSAEISHQSRATLGPQCTTWHFLCRPINFSSYSSADS